MIPALAIVAAVWIVLACLAASLPGCAYALGRFRARRARSYTNLITELPPVPAPKAELLDDVPVDCLSPAEVLRRFASIPEVAADLREQGAA